MRLNIEIVQTAGQYTSHTKNVADIHLAIDVIEMLLTRPNIKTFVIASGDGGFVSLINKLHEHGKTVVIATLKSSASTALCNSCDRFIEIEESSGESAQARSFSSGNDAIIPERQYEVLSKIETIDLNDNPKEAVLERIRKFFELIQDSREFKKELETGLPAARLRGVYVSALVKNFDHKRLGFQKSAELMSSVLKGTKLSVFIDGANVVVIAFKDGDGLAKGFVQYSSKRKRDQSETMSAIEDIAQIEYEYGKEADVVKTISDIAVKFKPNERLAYVLQTEQPVQIFRNVVSVKITNFDLDERGDLAKLGFLDFGELVRFAFRNTEIRLWEKTTEEGVVQRKLATKDSVLEGYEMLEAIETRAEPHSAIIYNALLREDDPPFNLADGKTIRKIARTLHAAPVQNASMRGMVSYIADEEELEQNVVVNIIKCFINAGAIESTKKEDGSDRLITMTPEYHPFGTLQNKLKEAIKSRITSVVR